MDLQSLLSRMTFEEKVGQLIQCNAYFFLASAAEITGPLQELGLSEETLATVGSVLNFENADEMRAIQTAHLERDPHRIPMLFMMDVIHGYRTIYPIPLALGCSFDETLVRDCSKMAAKEAAAGGIQVTFTPMVDYVNDARWGRVMETCGEDVLLNAVMGKAQVEAFQGGTLADPETLATCVKHFAAYGGVQAGRDYNTVDVSEYALRNTYLPAYRACLDAGAKMVMTSFSALSGLPAVANPWLMQTVLRDEWAFDGVVISDYNAVEELCVHGVAADLRQAASLAFENGCHIDMCSSAYANHLRSLVDDGVISQAQIDDAVLRVLRLKEELGLFDDPFRGGACLEKEERVCADPAHRALAKKAAVNSAVLLKNNGVLPFSKDVERVAVIGPFADEKAILGSWSCRGRIEEAVTVKDGIAALLPHAEVTAVKGCGNEWYDTDRSGFAGAVEAASRADVVVLCLGEPSRYSGEGNSRVELTLPGVQTELLQAVCKANPNMAVVLFNGRPLELSEVDAAAPAILDLWFPGSEGGSAAAALLFGDENPAGKLSMTFPRSVGQCPIAYQYFRTGRPKFESAVDEYQPFRSNYIDCSNTPLYPFGYGLSYSRVVYESLDLDADTMTASGSITVSVTVKNDSDRAGSDVVQLYGCDEVASCARPVQQLLAFEKVALAPHETKTVRFTIDEPMLRFWTPKNGYASESGTFAVSTGYADHLMHTKRFTLTV